MKLKYFKAFFIVATLILVVVTLRIVYFTEDNHSHNSPHSSDQHKHSEKEQIDQVIEEISTTNELRSFESLPFAYQVDQLIQKGDIKRFKETILKQENIREKVNDFSPEDGRTLLTRAAFGAPIEYIRFLVEELGADVNTADRDKITPLMEAAASENYEVIKYLIDNKADVNTQNKLGADSLTIALASGDASFATLLLENGANPNHKWNKKNFTHLMNAARSGHREVLNVLIDHSAQLNQQDDQGNTALHYAASQGFTEIVRDLLNSGANKEIQNIEMKTPINLAQEAGNTSTEQALK